MQLRDYQQAAVDGAYKLWREGKRSVIITMATGCHARGQGILMYDGTVRAVEDVVVGDKLMGPDSTPRTVLSLARGRQEMARIVPVKGEPWVVNMDHMLTLTIAGQGRDAWHDMSVRDWFRLHKTGKHIRKLVRVGVDFGSTWTPPFITPYALGVLIGDGELFWSGHVNKPDQELHAAMREEAYAMGSEWVHTEAGGNTIGHFAGTKGPGGNKVKTELKRLGLRVGSGEKFIPKHYLVAPRAARLELLAGLLDTDGHLGSNTYDWISKSQQLAEDICYLARSLGLAAYMAVCQKFCQTGAGGTFYRVCISGHTNCIPCRIPRKQATPRGRGRDVLHTGFTVEQLPEDDYFGFSLDGDQRYLLDDFTVTHNTGKSLCFKKFAHDVTMRGHRVLLLVEGQDLVEQAANHMRVAGLRVAVEMADQRVNTAGGDLLGDGPQVVVASIDSMVRRFARYPVEFFGLIITDECHHAASPSYRKVFGHFGFPVPREPEDGGGKYPTVGTCKMVGLTATPDRTDKKQLVPDIFEECAFDYPIKQAIEDGWLVPVKQVLCHLPGYDISKVRTAVGDLNVADLTEVLEPLVKPMVEEIVKVSEGKRRTLVYSVLKKLAHATTEALRGAGAGNVCTIVGETPRSSSVAANDSGTAEQRWPDRERMFEAFRRGDLPYLSSVATLIEGVDLPEAEVAAVLRPTKSGLVYTQIAGRVFRPLPGIVDGLKTAEERRAAIAASAKPYCIILDFAGNAGRHKLVRVLDLFADGLTEAQRKAADKLIESGECTDVLEAIERAREIIAEMERERAGRGVTSTNVDPFDVLAIPYARDQFDRPATEGQLMTLLRHGAVKGNIDKDRDKMLALAREKFDRTSASMYIDVVIQRTKSKQSTIKQAMLLVGKGIPAAVAKEMSFDRASAAMTELASMGWKPTPAWLDKYRKPQGEVAA